MSLRRRERERGDAFGKGTLPTGYVAGIRIFAVSAEDSSGNMHTRLDLDVVDVFGQRRPGQYRALSSHLRFRASGFPDAFGVRVALAVDLAFAGASYGQHTRDHVGRVKRRG